MTDQPKPWPHQRPPRDRRRLALQIGALALLLALGVLVATVRGGGGDDGAYRVRVVFDNASFLVTGEQVKVAGVVAGTIEKLELDARNKAVAIVRIEDPAFRPFRTDATCSVGLQSLIGEQFVDCKTTQPRAEGTPAPPELPVIRRGEGKGQHLLPVERTSSPVGIDLVTNVTRLPQQERLRLIVAELGAGVAANGETLRAAIVRANPALQQADRIVGILASQNKVLDRLVDDTDTALRPLAARRADLGSAVDRIGDVAAATAERGADLERNFERLPAFLKQLTPAAHRISALADQATPAVASLSRNAGPLSSSIRALGPFVKQATPAFVSLGQLADRGRVTLPRIRPLVDRLAATATPLRPVARELSALLTSLERAGGIESLLQTLYFYSGSINGADGVSHYLRATLQPTNCIDRTRLGGGSCRSDMTWTGGSAADTFAEARAKFGTLLADSPTVPVLPTSANATKGDSNGAGGGRDNPSKGSGDAANANGDAQPGDAASGKADAGGSTTGKLPGDDPERVRRALEALLGTGGKR